MCRLCSETSPSSTPAGLPGGRARAHRRRNEVAIGLCGVGFRPPEALTRSRGLCRPWAESFRPRCAGGG
jgi:hypothetical protein